MPFSNYKNIDTVAQEFQIQYVYANFVNEIKFSVNQNFIEELDFTISNLSVYTSEYAICESLIFPILKEVWKLYYDKLMLWSHRTLTYDEKLSGQPDYIVAQLSPLGRMIFGKPYFLLVEAKLDNFNEGWGQCLAELLAVQKINNDLEQTIFGIVSNGKFWEFGKLKGDIFTRNIASYNIEDLEKLFAVVNYVFQQCLLQLDNS
ncbi:hypothetical protein [Okeania sp.]|uniref:hypothetical protein n=1 Tax=Okeania sp. TaxID=3100323 RepID=UPI002B4B017A|nr:hypothetical protein [Okeania sp.]MEB3342297.1 hypothetical protein [Okeania sp.]